MKKTVLLFTAIFAILFSISLNSQAQANSDYFVGKWNVLVTGTPNGDAKMVVVMQRVDGKLKAEFVGNDQPEVPKVSNIEETEKSVRIYFTASGYDVYLYLENKGENHVEGNMLDMFDAKGDRATE